MAIVDSYSESNQSNTVVVDSNALTRGIAAQSFTSTGGELISASFYLSKTGSPTSSLSYVLYSHSGVFGTSSVGGTYLGVASNALDVTTLTGSLQLITLYFTGTNKFSMTAGTNYVIGVQYTSGTVGNVINVGIDDTSPTHAGNLCSFLSPTWTAVPGSDAIFYVNNGYHHTGISTNINGGVEIRPAAFSPGLAR